MKNQRGIALSGFLFWGFVVGMVAVLGMKVLPATIEYYKVLKDSKAAVAKVGEGATVADVKGAFTKFAEIDQLEFSADQLDISKENGRVVISFDYEKRIPLFWNVSLLINYKGSTAG